MATKSYRTVTLLLNRNVEGLGIVGDVVKVKPGFARNYLLPLGIAEPPTDERIEALKEARESAQAELERIRAERAGTIEALADKSIELVRSCNDRGILYGSVTQQDISDALRDLGHAVDERAVRLSQPIRRLGEFPVVVQFDKDLRSEIMVKILPDRSLAEEIEEMEFDNEGNLIEKPQRPRRGHEDAEASEDGEAEAESSEPTTEDAAPEPVEATSDNG
ncbi:MAG: 50S ribosomal protein L9 [Phycisphaerales bacterium]|nr:50S ribosomal protein L9 [Phycisphaerales bacterium]